ncbi:MAG: TlpA disulfide reductase family protein, partial [Terriglobia bacterium]
RQELPPGRRTLINLWATWCVPCLREMPELESLRPRLEAQGISLMGINVDTEPGVDIKGFVARTGVRYPVYVGGIPAIEAVFATDDLSVPLTLVVDERGVLEELIPGWSNETRQRFLELAGSDPSKKIAPDRAEARH